MPWKVKKGPKNKWHIVRSTDNKVVGTSNSKADAQASVRARYANTDLNEINAQR